MATLGIISRIDNSQLRKDSRELQRLSKRAADRLGSTFAAAAKVAAVGIAGLTAATAAYAVATTRAISDQTRFARTLRISIGEYQALAFAIREVGGDLDSAQEFLFDFTERLGEARAEAGPLRDSLYAVGLTTSEIFGSTNQQALSRYIELLGQLSSDQALFRIREFVGDEGGNIGLLLAQNSQGFQEAQQDAESLGITLSQDVADSVDDLRRRFSRLRAVITGAFAVNTADLLADLYGEVDSAAFDELEQTIVNAIDGFFDVLETDVASKLRSIDETIANLSETIEDAVEDVRELFSVFETISRVGLAVGTFFAVTRFVRLFGTAFGFATAELSAFYTRLADVIGGMFSLIALIGGIRTLASVLNFLGDGIVYISSGLKDVLLALGDVLFAAQRLDIPTIPPTSDFVGPPAPVSVLPSPGTREALGRLENREALLRLEELAEALRPLAAGLELPNTRTFDPRVFDALVNRLEQDALATQADVESRGLSLGPGEIVRTQAAWDRFMADLEAGALVVSRQADAQRNAFQEFEALRISMTETPFEAVTRNFEELAARITLLGTTAGLSQEEIDAVIEAARQRVIESSISFGPTGGGDEGERRDLGAEVLQDFSYDFRSALANWDFSDLGEDLVGSLANVFADAITDDLANLVEPFISGFFESLVGDITFASLFGGAGGSASGGFIPGAEGTPVPRILHGQEFVANSFQQKNILSAIANGANVGFGGGRGGGDVIINATGLSDAETVSFIQKIRPVIRQEVASFARAS